MAEPTKYMVFDIESLPDEQAFKAAQGPDSPEPPLDLVDRWLAERKAAGEDQFIPYTQQRPLTIGVCRVSPAFELLSVAAVSDPNDDPESISRQFWGGWAHYGCPTFVTYNGRGFDVPLMEVQALRYGIDEAQPWFAPTRSPYEQRRHRFNHKGHFDVQEFLSNAGATRIPGGLNLFSQMVGGAGKMGIDGSAVYSEYRAGNRERIIEYGLTDTLDTYLLFLRTQRLQGLLTAEREQRIRRQAVEKLRRHPSEVIQQYADLVSDRSKV